MPNARAIEAVLEAIDRQQLDTITALQDLVRIPSVTGDENRAQAAMISLLEEVGLKVESFAPTREEVATHPSFSDDGLPLGHRPVVVATTGTSGPRVILNGHIDVVPPGDESRWERPPWAGTIEKGAVWGRGACDMKGGLVAGWAALRAIASVGADLGVEVVFASVIGEESTGVGTLASVLRGHTGAAAIVLEPTRAEICPVGAGSLSFELEVPGRAAHGAMRQEGVSAVEKFAAIFEGLSSLERRRHVGRSHPLYPPDRLMAPLSVGTVTAGDWMSTVPERLVAAGRYGVFPGESIAAARAELEAAVAEAAADDSWLAEHPPVVRWVEGQFAPAETPMTAPLARAIGAAHQAVTGTEVGVHGVSYGSDLRFYVNDASMDAVLYGPGDVRHAHTVDERVAISDVIQVAKVVAVTLLRWDA